MVTPRAKLTTAITTLRHLSTSLSTPQPPLSAPTITAKTPAKRETPPSNGTIRTTLGKKLLGLVHPKRSAVVTINQWREKGNSVRKYELNRIVRELRKLKRYKHALEICEWMRTQEDIKLLPGDYAVHLDLIAKHRGLSSAEKFFEDLPERMVAEPTLSSLLHVYVQHRAYEKAEAVFAKMAECGYLKAPLPYNHMISMFLAFEKIEKIPELIEDLKKNTKPDIVTYNLWLTMCQSQNDVETAENVFLELKDSGLEPDWMTYSTLASLYMKIERISKVEYALKEMEKKVSRKNRSSYSSLISLYTSLGKKNEVCRIWKMMKSLFRKLNDSEYTCMIASLIKLGELEMAEKFYEEWELVSPTGDARIPNLLVGAYLNMNNMEKAKTFYDRFTNKGIVPSYTTWEIFAFGYIRLKQIDRVLDCFAKAVTSVKKWEPNMKFVREIFTLLLEDKNIEGAEKMLSILRKAEYVTTEIYNMLLQTYANAGKMPLIIEERMKNDDVLLDEDTKELLRLTSTMCVADVPSLT